MDVNKNKSGRRIDALLTEARNLDHDLKYRDNERCYEEAMNEELILIGQTFFSDHIFSLFACMLSGLTMLMYIPSIVSVLKNTGLSANPIGSFLRYLSTINHVMEWFKSPEASRKSLRKVRSIHSKVNNVTRMETGQKITQFDMVITQWAFFGPAFILGNQLGLESASDRELEGLAHHLYLIGASLGVKDEFNLCKGSLEEIKTYCSDIHERVILPCLDNPTPLGKDMARSMLRGAGLITPLIYPESYEAWTYRLYRSEKTGEKEGEIISTPAKIMYFFQKAVFDVLLSCPWLRWLWTPILNYLMRLNIFLANTLKSRILKEHQDKFIKMDVTKFWMQKTLQHKQAATTIGHEWMKFVLKQKGKNRDALLSSNGDPPEDNSSRQSKTLGRKAINGLRKIDKEKTS